MKEKATGAPLLTFSMKEWTMEAPLVTFSMKEKARGSTLHFLNEEKGEGLDSVSSH